MDSKKGSSLKQRKHNKYRLLVGILFLSITIGSSIGFVYADQDIHGLLSRWFDNKGSESILTIEQAIMTEKDRQKMRLKEELQLELKRSEDDLISFTEQERMNRINELKEYTNHLIANLHIDNEAEKQQMSEKLLFIMNEAINEMEKTIPKKEEMSPKEPDENNEAENDEKDKSEGETNQEDNGANESEDVEQK